jgi:hypothetical protein
VANETPDPPRDDQPTDCTTGTCPKARNFIIVYGDQGKDQHNVGALFELSAKTHQKEVRANRFPGVPHFVAGQDHLILAHVSSVADVVAQLQVGNVVYLAYFGHSWGFDPSGLLYIGQESGAEFNLGPESMGATPATALPASKFRSDAQIRLFGCRGGYGADSSGAQVAAAVHVPTFAYSNSGGSLFTTDATLGHGQRGVTSADINAKIPATAPNVWLIPINGTPTFRQF